MSEIRVIYGAGDKPPAFPAADQHPDAKYYLVGDRWVAAIGEPTQEEIDAVLNPAVETKSVTAKLAAIGITPQELKAELAK